MTIKVLLADDHIVVLKGIAVFLDEVGFEIVGEAVNGQEAVEMAEKLRPDIVIMDINMPLMGEPLSKLLCHWRQNNTDSRFFVV